MHPSQRSLAYTLHSRQFMFLSVHRTLLQRSRCSWNTIAVPGINGVNEYIHGTLVDGQWVTRVAI